MGNTSEPEDDRRVGHVRLWKGWERVVEVNQRTVKKRESATRSVFGRGETQLERTRLLERTRRSERTRESELIHEEVSQQLD